MTVLLLHPWDAVSYAAAALSGRQTERASLVSVSTLALASMDDFVAGVLVVSGRPIVGEEVSR